jgi:hypothetical protein
MFLVSQLKSETYKVLSELKRVLDLQIWEQDETWKTLNTK